MVTEKIHDTWCCWSCLFFLCLVRGWTGAVLEKNPAYAIAFEPLNPFQSDLKFLSMRTARSSYEIAYGRMSYYTNTKHLALFARSHFYQIRKMTENQHKNTIAWRLQFAKKVKNLTVATLYCTVNPDYCYQDKPGGGSLSCYNSSLKHFFCVSSLKCGFKLENMHFWSSFQVQ